MIVPLRRLFLLSVALLFLLSTQASITSSVDYSADIDDELTGQSKLMLDYATFDTKSGEPYIPPDLTIASYGTSPGYYLVQMIGPIKQEWREVIEATGAIIHDYVPDNTYIVYMDEKQKNEVGTLDFIQWIGIYHPAYRFNEEQVQTDCLSNYCVLTFSTIEVHTIAQEIESLGIRVLHVGTGIMTNTIIIETTLQWIPHVASINGVFWIEKETATSQQPQQPQLASAQWAIQSGEIGQRTIWDHGIRGEGQLVYAVGSGIELNCEGTDAQSIFLSDPFVDIDMTASTDNWTTAPPDFHEPNWNHRKIPLYHIWPNYTDPGDIQPTPGDEGHGTQFVMAICGDDEPYGGTSEYDGIAPKAKVIIEDGTPAGYPSSVFIPDFAGDLYRWCSAYFPNVSISANAIGHTTGYDIANARSLDEVSFENPMFLHFVPAGNDGLTSIANSKDAMVVGSLQPLPGGLDAVDSHSGHGPTDDGRIKPEITCPGNTITMPASGTTGGFVTKSGISFATSIAAGAGLLVAQYYQEGWYPTGAKNSVDEFRPSANLIKATMINSCTSVGDLGSYGWGRPVLDDTLYFEGDTAEEVNAPYLPALIPTIDGLYVHDDTTGLNTGEEWSTSFEIDISVPNVRFTLVWNDYPGTPGAPTAPKAVNNLDMIITDGSNSYYPNGLSSEDTKNNVEQVDISSPNGTYTVTISGQNIPVGPQPFALVVSGLSNASSGTNETPPPNITTEPIGNSTAGVYFIIPIAGGMIIFAAVWQRNRRSI